MPEKTFNDYDESTDNIIEASSDCDNSTENITEIFAGNDYNSKGGSVNAARQWQEHGKYVEGSDGRVRFVRD
ncbi:hypothetical protein V6N13_031825 [Hibiscus sabdariffa]|uniref:Uncharacterized protein n=1 Tax=Hibiscus sabdariffa TaxID=183260 RepID=A0ABR2NCW6_9ROSI